MKWESKMSSLGKILIAGTTMLALLGGCGDNSRIKDLEKINRMIDNSKMTMDGVVTAASKQYAKGYEVNINTNYAKNTQTAKTQFAEKDPVVNAPTRSCYLMKGIYKTDDGRVIGERVATEYYLDLNNNGRKDKKEPITGEYDPIEDNVLKHFR